MAVSLGLSLSQGTPNEQSRTTTVTARVIINYSGGSYNGNKPSGTLTIDGQTFNFSSNFNYAGVGQGPSTTGSGSTTACTKTITVSYGAATTRTVSASASFASGTASGTVSASNSINLTSIPAYSGSGGGDSGGGSGGSGDYVDPNVPPSAPWQGNATIDGQAIAYPWSKTLSYRSDTVNDLWNYGTYGVSVIKFKTPEFTGKSTSLDIYLYDARANDEQENCYYSVNYALCDSDENFEMYKEVQASLDDPNPVVNDPHKILQGHLQKYNLEVNEWEEMPFSIETDKLVGDKYYYLIFWIPVDNVLGTLVIVHGASMYHQIRVNYTDAPVVSTTIYGESGTQNTYEIMIDNGTGWDTYQAFIDNETKFEPYT